jgi:hypothetical protein
MSHSPSAERILRLVEKQGHTNVFHILQGESENFNEFEILLKSSLSEVRTYQAKNLAAR